MLQSYKECTGITLVPLQASTLGSDPRLVTVYNWVTMIMGGYLLRLHTCCPTVPWCGGNTLSVLYDSTGAEGFYGAAIRRVYRGYIRFRVLGLWLRINVGL